MLYKPEEFLALQTVDVSNDERYLLIKGGKHIIHLTDCRHAYDLDTVSTNSDWVQMNLKQCVNHGFIRCFWLNVVHLAAGKSNKPCKFTIRINCLHFLFFFNFILMCEIARTFSHNCCCLHLPGVFISRHFVFDYT